MTARYTTPWIPLEKVQNLLQPEPFLVILGLFLGSWLIYKLLLRKVSEERHRNLRRLFGNTSLHLAAGMGWFGLFSLSESWDGVIGPRLAGYLGLATLAFATLVFVKTCRILMFEYLFLGHMKVGVPLLLVNLFTLSLFAIVGGWLITDIFDIRLAPLLATSAVFSLVLGLALQDTLGNLFSGVALQFDKPYAIGDWIEIQSSGPKWVGQVLEISWRATVLISFTEELITVPNRIMGQSEVSNFSAGGRPVIRSQLFRLPYSTNMTETRKLLLESVVGIGGICTEPKPLVMVSEASENGVVVKLVYYLQDFGAQFLIADLLLNRVLERFAARGISIASPRLTVEHRNLSA